MIEAGWAANPDHRPGQRRHRRRPKHVNLLDRLDAHRDEVLRYAADLRVPFTNNGSEHAVLRMLHDGDPWLPAIAT